MAVTLKQVATQAGVSVPTVSAILNDKTQGFAPKTARRVREAAEQLGYRPNAYRGALMTKRFKSIGLLLSSHLSSQWLFRSTLLHIRRELDTFEQHLMMDTLPADDITAPRMLREWCVDGILVSMIDKADELAPMLARAQSPVVWLNQKLDFDCVRPDDIHGTTQATEHLLELGHTRIGYLHMHVGPETDHYSIPDREAGYRQTMTRAGLIPQVIRPPRPTRAEAYAPFMREMLRSPDRPTAFVTYGPKEALAVYAAAMELGLRVPEDLSLVGINDERINEIGRPVTTSRIAGGALGWDSVRMVMRMLDEPNMPQPAVVLPFKWESGDTTAPPRA